ncbi:MAG TPA: HlyD family secretion protein [Isosphaeraceae bacterium]|jgi:membrane fusion protein (multidrug efflux system)|nr:HlyD family secretion protein [Isosphaeraceae bacterium]
MSVDANTHAATPPPPDESPAPPKPPPKPAPGDLRRRVWYWACIHAIILAIIVAAYFAYPVARRALTTVSTDDAFVNGHVTFVAPRITETVTRVLVDDNDAVKKGDLLVVLDEDVWRVNVAQARAALDIAKKNEAVQLAKAHAAAATAKSNHFKLVSAMTDVRNRIASLRAAIASLREKRAAETLARLEAARYLRLAGTNSATREEADIRQTQYDQAQAAAVQALEQIHSLRAALEVPEEPPPGKPLDDLPPDLDQRHSTVVSALATFAQNLADLGLPLPSYSETPDAYIKRIHALAPDGDLDALIERTAANAPAVAAARANVEKAEKDLDLARLNLSYCEIRVDIDGYVSNRNVNPGNRVTQGQRLMAIRSADEVWIDCNFKETQLDPIRIGHPVDIYVDAYPGRVFKGRVTGFSPGTGASLALLPAQNATGNFVKIVQRLPVRVELVHGNPRDTPLFVGLSVIPYVLVNQPPEGPNAGQRLRGPFAAAQRSPGG